MASTTHEIAPSSNATSSGPRTLLLFVAILALAVAFAVAWQRLAASPTPAAGSNHTGSSTDELAPYRPGGSVYDSQVPEAARRTSPDELTPYHPGGSVYDSQVPEIARTTSP